jgi:hypothetical protein
MAEGLPLQLKSSELHLSAQTVVAFTPDVALCLLHLRLAEIVYPISASYDLNCVGDKTKQNK